MTPAIQIPLRSEIPEADTWDLTHIFNTEEEYRKSFSELKNSYSNFTEFKGHLGDSPETLLKCLEFNKCLEQIAERLAHYSSLKNSEDSSNNENLSRRAELTNLLTKFHEAASYIYPEIQAIPDDKFQRFLDDPVRSGAFSSSSYGNPPYILMNYKSDVFSHVFTLAHEAGHSMHSWFAQKHQLFQDYGYPIFLAEVASTLNEELTTHHLLNRAQEPLMRAYLIDRQIEDIRQVLFRQTMFAEFEKQVHEIEESGGPLTLDA